MKPWDLMRYHHGNRKDVTDIPTPRTEIKCFTLLTNPQSKYMFGVCSRHQAAGPRDLQPKTAPYNFHTTHIMKYMCR